MEQTQFLYAFTDEERAVIQRRYAAYAAAVQIVAEMHGLDQTGLPLMTDPTNSGFIAPAGMEIKKGETK